LEYNKQLKGLWFDLTPRRLFKIDACGAFISTILLIGLYHLESYIGLPASIVFQFIVMAILLMIYSATVYLLAPKNLSHYLKWLALFNLIYCAYTLFQIIQHFQPLSWYGCLYFVGEIMLVTGLAILELKVAIRGQA